MHSERVTSILKWPKKKSKKGQKLNSLLLIVWKVTELKLAGHSGTLRIFFLLNFWLFVSSLKKTETFELNIYCKCIYWTEKTTSHLKSKFRFFFYLLLVWLPKRIFFKCYAFTNCFKRYFFLRILRNTSCLCIKFESI